MTEAAATVGDLVRSWREQRKLSQLALAADAEISQKHLSFIESGRSAPSREMVLHLAEQLDIPLRERNAMLVAAGYAPIYRGRPLDDPALERARTVIDLILKAHEPYPALTVDRQTLLREGQQATVLQLPAAEKQPVSNAENKNAPISGQLVDLILT
jgi:transcriptional regulator with XRE-family HTH domain